MAETAYFYWPEISFEELDELVSSLKDQTEDKNLKVRETYLLRTKTRNITGSSVLELKKNNEISKMNVRKKIKISNLIFTIENRDGRISFDGTRHKRRVTFEELKKTKLWEKRKRTNLSSSGRMIIFEERPLKELGLSAYLGCLVQLV